MAEKKMKAGGIEYGIFEHTVHDDMGSPVSTVWMLYNVDDNLDDGMMFRSREELVAYYNTFIAGEGHEIDGDED